MEVKDMVCIVCPLGCKLKVSMAASSEAGYIVEGNKCARGKEYGIKELTNPTRVLTTTVILKDASINRLPVRTSAAIPKHLIKQAMEHINRSEVSAPVETGQIVINNLLGTGIDVIASRSINRSDNM
jgi:CxxC motif-containing protein